MLGCQDLKFISNKIKFLNFKESDINAIKLRLKRDFYYLCKNKITNFTLQLIVEENRMKKPSVVLSFNSFMSADAKYIYHFGISDYLESYQRRCAKWNTKP